MNDMMVFRESPSLGRMTWPLLCGRPGRRRGWSRASCGCSLRSWRRAGSGGHTGRPTSWPWCRTLMRRFACLRNTLITSGWQQRRRSRPYISLPGNTSSKHWTQDSLKWKFHICHQRLYRSKISYCYKSGVLYYSRFIAVFCVSTPMPASNQGMAFLVSVIIILNLNSEPCFGRR